MASHVKAAPFTVLLLMYFTNVASFAGVHRRFEYKHSFKGPHLVQEDGTIPFWEHSGHAIASDESIRITPSLRSKKGLVWNSVKANMVNWEVEFVFRISGRGRVGADGLAFWFTQERGVEGPVFGSSDQWNGLGIFMDSFDNDGQHNNPYIMAMVNDGSKVYNHATDGATQQLGGCLRDYRNKPYPVRLKVEYYQQALTILVNLGVTNQRDQFEMCMRVENVQLPVSGYFGVSAATGGLADDHDVSALLTHSLVAPVDLPQDGRAQVSDDERKKFEQEFDEYYEKLQKARDDYRKEHPDEKIPDEEDGDKWFESQDERELKMIFEGQTSIHRTVSELHRKMDEVIGRQERTLSQISLMSQTGGGGGGATGGTPQGGGQQQLPYVDTIKRHEVDTVINSQRDLGNSIRELRNMLTDVQSKTTSIHSSGGGRGSADAGVATTDIKNHINTLGDSLKAVLQKQGGTPCPQTTPSNCVTNFYLVFFMMVQVAVILGYMIYRNNREAQAKKFY